MPTPQDRSEDTSVGLADRVAETVLRHPCVVRLHGGEFGVVASHLPGRKVTGVRVGEPDEPIEVAVVALLRRPLPDVVAELRERVNAVAGDVPVHITVGDVVTPARQQDEPATEADG